MCDSHTPPHRTPHQFSASGAAPAPTQPPTRSCAPCIRPLRLAGGQQDGLGRLAVAQRRRRRHEPAADEAPQRRAARVALHKVECARACSRGSRKRQGRSLTRSLCAVVGPCTQVWSAACMQVQSSLSCNCISHRPAPWPGRPTKGACGCAHEAAHARIDNAMPA